MSDKSNNIPGGRDGMDDRLGNALGGALGRGRAESACPALEDLAALAEGIITGSERDILLTHLADCGRCREVYTLACETAQEVMEAEAAAKAGAFSPPPPHLRGRGAGGLGASLPSRPRARYYIPAALAASILLVVVSWPVLTGRNKEIPDTAHKYAGGPIAANDTDRTPAPPSTIPEAPPVQGAVPAPVEKPASPPVAESPAAPPRFSVVPEPSAQVHETPAQAAPAPPVTEAPASMKAETAPQPRAASRSTRIKLDERLKLALGKLDKEVLDKYEIASLFKELELAGRDFHADDVKKVVIKWPVGVKADADGNPAFPEPARASVTLGDEGVLTIVIKKERSAISAVGC